jgi:hypothetical protein
MEQRILNTVEARCREIACPPFRLPAVLKDRRRFARRPINRIAKFHAGVGSLPRDCMVTDISENGARLYCELEVPEQFTLLLNADGEDIRQDCRVVWRLGGELGVEFTRRSPR